MSTHATHRDGRPAEAAATIVLLALGRLVRGCAALGCAALVAACSSKHYIVNPPLAADARTAPGYATRHLEAPGNSDSLVVMAAFSGGGYRAAAMAHAVLEVLRDTPIVWEAEPRTLLGELDMISAVSAGSLAAAYYARDPARFFEEFRPRVLELDLQSRLYLRGLSPRALWWQTSPTWGRGDLLAEVLDEHVFDGLTYGDLPRRRPMVHINATDMRQGERFVFSQDRFDQLCSDLDRFSAARAVAASMAVPIVFSPITVWNHHERCPQPAAAGVTPGHGTDARYIHLVDGGLADNTGVRMLIEAVAAQGGLLRASHTAGLRGVRTGVFIVVNASVDARHDDDRPDTPGLWRQLRSAIDVPIDRYSASSLDTLARAVRSWSAERDSALGAIDDLHLIEIGVGSARGGPLADAVRAIPTTLRIEPAQIDLVRDFVRAQLADDPAWQRLLARLRAPMQAHGERGRPAATLAAASIEAPP